MISLVINCDTRPGCDADVNTTGDHGEGSLNGVRSWDFLTDGVINKLNFFQGHEVELILYVDEHEPLPPSVTELITAGIIRGDIQQLICKPHPRTHRRWNEMIYLEALKLAHGDYVAHFDGDCAAFSHPDRREEVIERHVRMLETPHPVIPNFAPKFICQPTTLTFEEHGMTWASTRFFFCRRESLNLPELEKCILDESYRAQKYGHCPALEHVLAGIAGRDSVFYPPANWNEYMIFSWSRYHRGLLKELNAWDYDDVRDYIVNRCGIHGPNDVISQGLP